MLRERFSTLAVAAAAIASLGQLVGQARADIILVNNGTPVATIVLPDDPTTYEKLVAQDFQFHIEQISGATLEIIGEKDRPEGVCVDIGGTSRGLVYRQQLAEDDKLNDEALLIRVTSDRAIMVGRTDLATNHAVFILLEQLGVRWPLPTNKGSYIPKHRTVRLQQQHTIDQPLFIWRAGAPSADAAWYPRGADETWHPSGAVRKDSFSTFDVDIGAWSHRNRFSDTMERRLPAHTYNFLVPKSAYFAEHPEYYALQENGKREPYQLCTSNPQVIHIATEKVRAYAKNYPNALLSVSPNDKGTFCQCDNCLAIEGKDGNLADRLMTFANHIAREVGKDYPNTRYTYFVDYHSTGLPGHTKPEPNLVFWLVRPSNIDRAHGIGHPNVKRWEQSLHDWTSYDNPVILYTYYGFYTFFTYWPMVHIMKEEFPYYYKHGVIGTYSEMHKHWGTQGLNFYVYGKLAWNPLADVDAVVVDYCRAAFGPAAKTMRQYYDFLEHTMEQAPSHYGTNAYQQEVFTPKVVAKADALMAKAVQQVKSHTDKHPDPGMSWRMAFVARGQQVSKLDLGARHALMRYHSTRDEPLLEQAREAWMKVLEIINDPAMPGVVEREGDRFVRKIEGELAALKPMPLYGPGKFYFSDSFDGGVKTAQTQVNKGFFNGAWGLNLRSNQSGEISWRFEAKKGCVFETAQLYNIWFKYVKGSKNSNKIEVRSAATNGKYVSVVKNRDLEKATFDITKHVCGTSRFEVRCHTHNGLEQNITALDNFELKGTVIKAQPPGLE